MPGYPYLREATKSEPAVLMSKESSKASESRNPIPRIRISEFG